MSKSKLLLGLIIIVALITAGCTGTKTMVGKDQTTVSAGQTAAMNDYNKYAGQLSQELDYLLNHYKPSSTMTLDEYSTWLDGFKDKLALCGDMYNNTSEAAIKYLAYLNSSSPEYGNVTANDTNYTKEIASLNNTYAQYSNYMNTSIQENDALNIYKQKLNASFAAYDDLTAYAKGTKINSLSDYSNFISTFGQKQSAFASSANDAIAAGNEYKQYLDPNSTEAKGIDDNANALTGQIQSTSAAYAKYQSDYSSKVQAQSAAKSAFTNYVNLMTTAVSDEKAVEAYNGTATAMQKLNKDWIAGYKQKIDTFDADANSAISAGDTCKQYLDPSSSDYQTITTNENNMRNAMSSQDQYYNELDTTYNDLYPLGSLLG